jgi:chemotaxis protein methyltransferase CheR
MTLERAGTMSAEEFRLLREVIHAHCGLSFGEGASYLLEGRLSPRLQYHGLPDFASYVRFLRHDAARAAELDAVVEALATHETYFYREPHQLRAFGEEILPGIAARNARQKRLRIWSAGCSTGEEVYTIAHIVERTGLFHGWDVDVFGSDIVRRVISTARAGSYGPRAFRTPEGKGLRATWRVDEGRWVVPDELRRMVSFGLVNLVDSRSASMVGPVDVVFCRNVLIYFELPARRRVLRTFWSKLRPRGYLLLGHSESLLNVTGDFELVPLRHDLVYRKPTPPS